MKEDLVLENSINGDLEIWTDDCGEIYLMQFDNSFEEHVAVALSKRDIPELIEWLQKVQSNE